MKKHIEMNIQIAPNIYVKNDEQSLRQLISILLDNTIKYADQKGEINVKPFKQDLNVFIQV